MVWKKTTLLSCDRICKVIVNILDMVSNVQAGVLQVYVVFCQTRKYSFNYKNELNNSGILELVFVLQVNMLDKK